MINDLKDLKALFKICRAQGITDFKMNGMEIKFGDMPTELSVRRDLNELGEENPNYSNFPQGELSPEQLAFYSTGGRPENDPFLKEAAT